MAARMRAVGKLGGKVRGIEALSLEGAGASAAASSPRMERRKSSNGVPDSFSFMDTD